MEGLGRKWRRAGRYLISILNSLFALVPGGGRRRILEAHCIRCVRILKPRRKERKKERKGGKLVLNEA